jgi:hypothetical protein
MKIMTTKAAKSAEEIQANVAATVSEALSKANIATKAFIQKNGEDSACGFAWCEIRGLKLSTKLGKAFAKAGFSRGYNNSIDFWNPSRFPTQSMNALEEGARVFTMELKEKFPDLTIYPCSRYD